MEANQLTNTHLLRAQTALLEKLVSAQADEDTQQVADLHRELFAEARSRGLVSPHDLIQLFQPA